MPLMYLIVVMITPFAIPKWIEIRVTLIIGCILLGGSVLLVGPVHEDNLIVMIIGLFLTGALLAPIVIPNMNEMMNATKIAYPESDLEHANSLLSGILNGCFGIGQALGSLMGAALY